MTLSRVWAGVRWASQVPPVPFSVPVVMLVSQVIEPLPRLPRQSPRSQASDGRPKHNAELLMVHDTRRVSNFP